MNTPIDLPLFRQWPATVHMTRGALAGVLLLLAILRPVAGLAQASSYEIGGPAHQVSHAVDILNCCAHFTMATDSTQEATITVSGPPWSLQPTINGEYGSATATSSTQISGASTAGVSVKAVASGSASPGILPGWALRASSSQGGTYYSFVLDQASYVEMHGSAGYAHSPGASFAASVSLRVGSAGGAAISGFSLDVNSNSNPGFTSTTINAPPVLLGPGTYVLVGSLSADASAYATGNAENVSANLSVTLQIHSAPDADPIGTAMCVTASSTITRPGGSPQALAAGAPIHMGDVIDAGADGRVCVLFIDDTQFSLSANGRLKIDEYVYDPDSGTGKGHYDILGSMFRYVSGLIGNQAHHDLQLDTPTGTIGIRGTEFIGNVGTGTDSFYLAQGTVAPTSWHTGVTTVTDALATIAISDTGVTTSPLAQADYDALKATLIDTDGDGTVDASDDCTLLANPTQLDGDSDGYGNACDGDLNNSGLVTATDFNLLRSVLNAPAGSGALAAAADLNGSGLVTATDFNLLRARLNTAPGPSGLHP